MVEGMETEGERWAPLEPALSTGIALSRPLATMIAVGVQRHLSLLVEPARSRRVRQPGRRPHARPDGGGSDADAGVTSSVVDRSVYLVS